MFTGLVQELGQITSITKSESSAVLTFYAPISSSQIEKGDSIAINGVCLTAVEIQDQSITADVMVQTLQMTNLGELDIGSLINVELSARLGALMGGHIVQGHIDGVARVVERTPGDKWEKFVVKIPKNLSRYVVNQGSIALDGVSLTVGEIADSDNLVTVWLIPETLATTNFSRKNIGNSVNVEVDVLAKYVERLVSKAVKDDK